MGVYIDYMDLNKAFPKGCFPFFQIDQLIDATAVYELLSFMDVYSGYNKILMNETNQARTIFTTDQGLYCYRVVHFKLKNAEATHRRLVNKLFTLRIGKSMEVYVDDMLVKNKRASDHIEDLKDCCNVLRQYQMKLNLVKCAFGVESEKFLRFMVNHRDIEVNLAKAQAVIDLQPSRSVKEIQRLIAMIVAFSLFVSRFSDKYYPFF